MWSPFCLVLEPKESLIGCKPTSCTWPRGITNHLVNMCAGELMQALDDVDSPSRALFRRNNAGEIASYDPDGTVWRLMQISDIGKY